MRPVVPLHTIEQWYQVDEATKALILQHIRLRDRLWAHVLMREQKKVEGHNTTEADANPMWVACKRCEQRGWVLHRPRRPGIHPSQMASTCLLKIYKEFMGEPQEVVNDAKALLIFEVGTAVHEMLQGYGRQGAWGPIYQPEVNIGDYPLAKELCIEGHCDADNVLTIDSIPDHPIYEVGVVHEYKTINNNGYEALKNRPKPSHKQQAVVYSACLNRPVVVYLYVNKDNSNIADFPVPFDYAHWETVRRKAEIVRDAGKAGTPPPGDVGYHCKQCGYYYSCEYRKQMEKKG